MVLVIANQTIVMDLLMHMIVHQYFHGNLFHWLSGVAVGEANNSVKTTGQRPGQLGKIGVAVYDQ